MGDDLLGESDSNDDADKSDGSNYAREIEAIQDENLASDDSVNDESEYDSDDDTIRSTNSVEINWRFTVRLEMCL